MIGQTISNYKILEKLGGAEIGVACKPNSAMVGGDIALTFPEGE